MQTRLSQIIVNDCKQDGSVVWQVPIREPQRNYGRFCKQEFDRGRQSHTAKALGEIPARLVATAADVGFLASLRNDKTTGGDRFVPGTSCCGWRGVTVVTWGGEAGVA